MFDNMNLGEMINQFQQKAKEMADESSGVAFTAKSGGGLIKVTTNGNAEVVDIEIDESLMSDKESMQILLISAINDAIKMSLDNKQSQTLNMLKGFGVNLGQKA